MKDYGTAARRCTADEAGVLSRRCSRNNLEVSQSRRLAPTIDGDGANLSVAIFVFHLHQQLK
jgi:hypothetical protein